MPSGAAPRRYGAGAHATGSAEVRIRWVCSSAERPWQWQPATAITPVAPDTVPQVRLVQRKKYQTIDGFGGCFNELGWVALLKLSEPDRARVLDALFGDAGCAFNLARVPIGASDFALDAYSLDDVPGDLELKHFSIRRDEQYLIPYIKAAMKVRPGLRCWGSPWSPPAWMKTNNYYAGGAPRWEPSVLRAYANYLVRWAQAYRSHGIHIYAIAPQNEPNIASKYPSCVWSGVQLREFIAEYLGPAMRRKLPGVELWLGTLNGDPIREGENPNARLMTVMEDPRASRYVSAIAIQYDSRNQMAVARELYPHVKLVQSETKCNRGENSWADALNLFKLMRQHLEAGASSYFAWNMVLDQTGKSSWGWRQNSLVTVDTETGQVKYNGEFYVMRHFSGFIKPGARRVLVTGTWPDALGFVNPDGSVVAVVANLDTQPRELVLMLGERAQAKFKATLAAGSVNTFVWDRPGRR